MTEKELLARITQLAQRDDLPDSSPGRVGVLVFESLIRDWDTLSPTSRNELQVALGMLARALSAEARAERVTADILERLRPKR